MDTLLGLAQGRQSCRNFDPARPVEREKLAACLQETGLNRFTENARAFVVVIEGRQNFTARMGGSLKNQPFSGIDIGLSVAHLILAAADQGLASCVVGWFNERKIKMLLGIPKTRRVRLVVSLGYAAGDDALREKDRKAFDEIVTFNHF